MKVKELARLLENLAPPMLAEEYDNIGLLTGSPDCEITGVLCTLDCIESVIEEAVQKKCNMVVAHHPIIFKGLKKITGKNYVERTIIKAIQNNIAIYAIHTNLDHVMEGVNMRLCNVLGIHDVKILKPSHENLFKVCVYVPHASLAAVEQAMFAAGAGHIGNYSECGFVVEGTGGFKANNEARPAMGEANKRHLEPESRLEVLVPTFSLGAVTEAMKKAHPYEEVAYDIFPLKNSNPYVGAGMIGVLEDPMDERAFLLKLKTTLGSPVRHTSLRGKSVKTVAVCGGSGSFLLSQAIQAGADVFVTGDFKYHEFFDADNQIVIADVGHFESEQFTRQLLAEYIEKRIKNIATFAVRLSEVDTNPVKYF